MVVIFLHTLSNPAKKGSVLLITLSCFCQVLILRLHQPLGELASLVGGVAGSKPG